MTLSSSPSDGVGKLMPLAQDWNLTYWKLPKSGPESWSLLGVCSEALGCWEVSMTCWILRNITVTLPSTDTP
jgi:hypothetical protein